MGTRPARRGTSSVSVADERRRSRVGVHHRSGSHVGNRHSPVGRRPGGAADVAGSSLNSVLVARYSLLDTRYSVLGPRYSLLRFLEGDRSNNCPPSDERRVPSYEPRATSPSYFR